jgi:hypothetical protein
MSIFCKHKWEVMVDKLVPSMVERILQISPGRVIDGPGDMRGFSITILSCQKCGAINKTVVSV